MRVGVKAPGRQEGGKKTPAQPQPAPASIRVAIEPNPMPGSLRHHERDAPPVCGRPPLRRSYPVSAVLRTSPPPQSARPVPHGRPVGPVISDLTTLWGFPCCARFPCVRAAATTPVQRLGVVLAHLTQPCQPSPITSSGRPAHRPFRGLLSVHSRCGPHTRAG